jgi:PAS domain S-box-containing protein
MHDAGVLENEDLRRTNQTLHSIITASPHAIIAVDAERNVRLWNPAAEKIFGWKAEETVGGRVPFVNAASRVASDDFNQRALRGESFTNHEIQRTRRDGTPIELLVSAAPTYDEKGQVDGFLTVATDVTEQKSLERQFLRTQRLESVGHAGRRNRARPEQCARADSDGAGSIPNQDAGSRNSKNAGRTGRLCWTWCRPDPSCADVRPRCSGRTSAGSVAPSHQGNRGSHFSDDAEVGDYAHSRDT